MASSTVNQPELTAEQVQRRLVKPLEQASAFLAAGPRIFDVTAAGVVRIPKLVSMGAPAWHGENELITEVDPDFGEVVLLNGTKSLKEHHPLLQRAGPLVGRRARRSAARQDGPRRRREDRRRLHQRQRRDRHPVRPARLHRRAADHRRRRAHPRQAPRRHGARLHRDVDTARLRWFMPSRTFIALRKLKDASNQYLLQPDVTADAPFRLLGIPVTVTNRIPTTAAPAPTRAASCWPTSRRSP